MNIGCDGIGFALSCIWYKLYGKKDSIETKLLRNFRSKETGFIIFRSMSNKLFAFKSG